MELIVLRHPSVRAKGLCYGRHEVALAAGAAAEIAAALAALPPAQRVLTSPSRRALPLAHAIARRDGLRAETDPRLMELDFGTWEGRPWTAIARSESDPWAEDPITRAPPGGETFAALLARVRAALAGVEGVVVTHAGPIRALRMLGGADFDAAFAAPVPHAVPLRFPPVPV